MENTHPRIHIIVNCASRKRTPPTAELGSILSSNLKNRVAVWWRKLNNFSNNNSISKNRIQRNINKTQVQDLYVGSYWSNIRGLSAKAKLSGFTSNLWVISAGYGLISASDEIFSYSATFASGDKNSVTNGGYDHIKRREILNSWWELISDNQLPGSSNPRKLTQLIQENPGDYFLVVLSADYLTAVEKDLLKGMESLSATNNLVIITSKSFLNKALQKNIISVDARLQCNGKCEENCKKHLLLRGIRGAIGASLAGKIIERAQEHEFSALDFKQFVQNHIEQSPSLVNFNRTRLSNTEICKFIEEELKKLPSASCTLLLRKLRNNGLACEQKRFSEHYWSTKGMHNEK